MRDLVCDFLLPWTGVTRTTLLSFHMFGTTTTAVDDAHTRSRNNVLGSCPELDQRSLSQAGSGHDTNYNSGPAKLATPRRKRWVWYGYLNYIESII